MTARALFWPPYPQSDTWYPSIPFQQSKVGESYNIDVASGYLGSDPTLPSIASSTTSATCLIAFDDHRNFLGDICGTMLNSSTRLTSNISAANGSKEALSSMPYGDYHTLGVRSDGSLWAWGNNAGGQLGLGDSLDRPTPTRAGSESNWAMIEGGYYHSFGIRSDGSLWAWGDNYTGQWL